MKGRAAVGTSLLVLGCVLPFPAPMAGPSRHEPLAEARWSGGQALAASRTGKIYFEEMLASSGIDYRNVSGDSGKSTILGSLGSGAALVDYDLDGDLDVYLVNGAALEAGEVRRVARNRLYRNDGDWAFTDVTDDAGVGHDGWGMGVAAGDIDNDGAPDLFVTNIGSDALYRNRGDGTFVEEAAGAGVADEGWGTSAAFLDLEGDGDLDLYVARYLEPDVQRLPAYGSRTLHGPGIIGDIECRYSGIPVFCGPEGLLGQSDLLFANQGDGTFTDVTRRAGIFDLSRAYGLGVVVGDYDDDGDADVYVANDSVPNFLYRNRGDGSFEEVGLEAGVAVNADGRPEAGMGVDLGDVDGDADLDLFVTNFSGESDTLYVNTGQGRFRDGTEGAGIAAPSEASLSWATRFFDVDNDTDADLLVANGHVYPQVDTIDGRLGYAQENQLFLNDGAGIFEALPDWQRDPGDVRSSRGGAFGDIDADGRVDVVLVSVDGPPELLRNVAEGAGHWISLRLLGTRSNRTAIGARVTLVGPRGTQVQEVRPSGSFLSSNDPRLHFGLGDATGAVSLTVRWPGGETTEHRGLSTDRHWVVSQSGRVWSRR